MAKLLMLLTLMLGLGLTSCKNKDDGTTTTTERREHRSDTYCGHHPGDPGCQGQGSYGPYNMDQYCLQFSGGSNVYGYGSQVSFSNADMAVSLVNCNSFGSLTDSGWFYGRAQSNYGYQMRDRIKINVATSSSQYNPYSNNNYAQSSLSTNGFIDLRDTMNQFYSYGPNGSYGNSLCSYYSTNQRQYYDSNYYNNRNYNPYSNLRQITHIFINGSGYINGNYYGGGNYYNLNNSSNYVPGTNTFQGSVIACLDDGSSATAYFYSGN